MLSPEKQTKNNEKALAKKNKKFFLLAPFQPFNIKKMFSNNKQAKQLSAQTVIVVVAVIFFIGLFVSLQQNVNNRLVSLDSESINGNDWQKNYVDRIKSGEEQISYDFYLESIENTPYYDYDNFLIAGVAAKIAKESDSSLEAIRNTLSFVHDRVSYTRGEPDKSCIDGTAPQILNSGSGQCDTESIVVIAILRRMGIAAKPVGGCVFPKPNKFLQSVLLNSVSAVKAPVYEPAMTSDGVVSLSRGFSAGGLHAWVVAYVPGTGWLPLEVTTGSIANTDLYAYHVELFPKDSDKKSICSSNNYYYAKACYNKDLSGLNQYGLGLMEEVVVR